MPHHSASQATDKYGQYAAPDEATVLARKTAVLTALASGSTLKAAVAAAGISYPYLWYLSKRDEELAEALESWRLGLGIKSLGAMEEDMDSPETAPGLKSPTYGNFRMITAKAAFPDMRDNYKVEVNVGVQVNAGDIDAAAEAYFKRRAGDRLGDQRPS